MRKIKKRGIFVTVMLYSIVVCVFSTLAGVASGIFFYVVETSLSQQNVVQRTEFEGSKKVLDTVDSQYIARFEPGRTEEIKKKLAQQVLTALLDTSQIRVLYGYDQIERILANQLAGGQDLAAATPKVYNWPVIRLVSMMYNSTTCTTMVEFKGGENRNEQKQQVWKWEYKGGKWVPLSFSDYFVPSDVEISRQGISFVLSPKHDTKLTKLFVLNK
jgi:hypothetical protein